MAPTTKPEGDQRATTTVVGKSVLRVEGRDQVTGRLQFVDDIQFAGMLYTKVKMSPYPNARILSIDASRAEKLPGVEAVLTHKDIPHNRFGGFVQDQPVLADEYVRHVGQAVVAVAAVDEDVAQQAVDLVQVEYEPLPPIFDVHESMRPGAPLIHDGGNVHYYAGRDHREIRLGDVEEGFRQADLLIEKNYTIQMREHCPIEPQVSVAVPDYGGKVNIYSVTQAPFFNQILVAGILKKPLNLVRVISGTVGGGFGAKNDLSCDHITALLALKTQRPVKWLWTREEEFLNSSVDNPYPVALYKTGVKKDGTITALYVKAIQDAGAFCIFSTVGLDKFGIYGRGPYNIPNYWSDGWLVYTNKPASGALRGFNVSSCGFTYEANMDFVAAQLGLDPVEFRLKNLVKEGDLSATQMPMKSVTARETLMGAIEGFGGWDPRPAGPRDGGQERRSFALGGADAKRRGRGVSVGYSGVGASGGNDPSMAEVELNHDGSIKVKAGAVDIGGGEKTVLSQIAAEEMGVPLEDIRIILADTENTPLSTGTFGNRETYITGNAIRQACGELKQILFDMASEELNVAPEQLELRDRMVVVVNAPEQAVPIADLASKAVWLQGKYLAGRGGYHTVANWIDDQTGKGLPTEQYIFGTSVAEVEVDVDTGEVKVTKLSCCHDVGKAVNPLFVHGQLDGGIATGLGLALLEDMLPFYPGVDHITTGFHDYKIPTSADMPEVKTVFLEIPSAKGPYGAKSFGEFSANTQAAAIINAIHDAVGVWITDLPATPDKVLKALQEKQGKA